MAERYVAEAVVTCDAAMSVHVPGVVDVAGGRVQWVGPYEGAPPAGASIHNVGGLLMPGLVNTHCHSPMTLLRGAGEGLVLDRWLHEVIWPRESKMTDEDAYWGMVLACGEMLLHGVTTSCEMYFFQEAIARAVEACGMRSVITPGIILAPGWEQLGSWQVQLESLTAFHARFHGSAGGLISVGFGPHSAYTVPMDATVAAARRAAELGAVLHLHLAETRSEGAMLEAEYGESVPRILARKGVLDGDVLAAHSVWLDDGDIEIYADNDVAVAHCPQSNCKLGSGIARIADMVDEGIVVALGTDGPASNNNLDLWEELRLAPLLARAVGGDAGALDARTVLAMATRNGAAALKLAGVGSLEAGHWADMVRIDTATPAFAPIVGPEDYISHLVWASSSSVVTDVWVAGRPVVAGGQCLTVDVAEACRHVHERARLLAGT